MEARISSIQGYILMSSNLHNDCIQQEYVGVEISFRPSSPGPLRHSISFGAPTVHKANHDHVPTRPLSTRYVPSMPKTLKIKKEE